MGPVTTIEDSATSCLLLQQLPGLGRPSRVVEAGHEGLRRYAVARRACDSSAGRLSAIGNWRTDRRILGTEAALTYVSCWNANEVAGQSRRARGFILSDELNHASIIDAGRLAPRRSARSFPTAMRPHWRPR